MSRNNRNRHGDSLQTGCLPAPPDHSLVGRDWGSPSTEGRTPESTSTGTPTTLAAGNLVGTPTTSAGSYASPCCTPVSSTRL